MGLAARPMASYRALAAAQAEEPVVGLPAEAEEAEAAVPAVGVDTMALFPAEYHCLFNPAIPQTGCCRSSAHRQDNTTVGRRTFISRTRTAVTLCCTTMPQEAADIRTTRVSEQAAVEACTSGLRTAAWVWATAVTGMAQVDLAA